ncbi:aa3-type cytochrome oxidase subunit CtaJ [Modestobacter versicolor]|uniref:aa3-type cytochrome oxidase subunit CtaJ n=1 Tax=Modestobacter versicolor TaxID=429133 RepID=UPI0034DF5DAC
MSVIETVLIYGVIPLVVFLLFAAVTILPGRGQQRTKYRPGQPWTAAPVWWEPHPDTSAGASHGSDHGDDHAAPRLGATAAALAIGQRPHEPHAADAPRRTAAGGARGTW